MYIYICDMYIYIYLGCFFHFQVAEPDPPPAVGSRRCAERYRDKGASVVGVIQNDVNQGRQEPMGKP